MALFKKQKKQLEESETSEVGTEEELLEDSNITPYGTQKTEYSYPMLVMEAVSDCRKKRAVEMKKGHWIEKMDKAGNVNQIWVEDTRRIFISSVKSLRELLLPKIKADKEYMKIEEEINKKQNDVFNEYAYEVLELKRNQSGNITAEKSGKKIMPEKGAVVTIWTNKGWQQVSGAWDMYLDIYIDEGVELYGQMFGELNCLIERLGFFRKRAIIG